MFSWGGCAHGELGLPSRPEYAAPELVPALSGLRILRIACGAAHAVALTEDAQLVTWGSNEHGQVGHHRSKHWQGPERLEVRSFYLTDTSNALTYDRYLMSINSSTWLPAQSSPLR